MTEDVKCEVELAAGGVLGILALGEAAAGAAVCPLCVIAAPILLGIGAYKRVRNWKGGK